MKFVYEGTEYEISTKLKVAFVLQDAFNHKPYMQILEDLADMDLNDQTKVLYTAFNFSNPGVCKFAEFQSYVQEEMNYTQFMETINELGEGIMYHGYTPEQIAEKKAQNLQRAQEAPALNRAQRRAQNR